MNPRDMNIDPSRVALIRAAASDPSNAGLSNRKLAAKLDLPESAIRRAMAFNPTQPPGKPMKIAPKKLKLDGGTQPREAINQDVVEEYAEAMRAGVVFPPADVFYDGVNYWLADGFHRTLGAIAADVKKVEVAVHMGTVRDAILFSLGANARHGLRRSNADKRRAVMVLLKDEEWGRWSNAKIADQCGVSGDFVGTIRNSHSNPIRVTEVKTINKHGQETTINTTNIGRKPKPQVDDSEWDEDDVVVPTNLEDDPEIDDSDSDSPITKPIENEPVFAEPEPNPKYETGTVFGDGFEGDDPEPTRPDTDDEWLASLPLSGKLSGRTLELFRADALAYRRLAGDLPEWLAWSGKLRKALSAGKHNARGPYLSKLDWLASDVGKHPRGWLLCGACHGQGNCDVCKRAGYVVS